MATSSRLSRPALTQSLKSITRVDPSPTTFAAMPPLTEPVLRGPLDDDNVALCDGDGAIRPDGDAGRCVLSFSYCPDWRAGVPVLLLLPYSDDDPTEPPDDDKSGNGLRERSEAGDTELEWEMDWREGCLRGIGGGRDARGEGESVAMLACSCCRTDDAALKRRLFALVFVG